MNKKRRSYTDKFKAKVALEAISGMKTMAELSSYYKVHTNQISKWKKQLIENASLVFSNKNSQIQKTEEELTAPLYEEIGRLKMDINWLKKKL